MAWCVGVIPVIPDQGFQPAACPRIVGGPVCTELSPVCHNSLHFVHQGAAKSIQENHFLKTCF